MGNCRYFCWYYDLLVTGKAIGPFYVWILPACRTYDHHVIFSSHLLAMKHGWKTHHLVRWFSHWSFFMNDSQLPCLITRGYRHQTWPWTQLMFWEKIVPNWWKKVEIVDLPMKNGGSFHSYVTVYQRVTYTYNMFSRWGYKMLTSYN